MEILQFIFVLLSFLVVIIVYLFNKINKLEKNNIENMTSVEHMTSDVETIRNLIREEYNHDIEAIRNLGAISKSLLTGKNYHNTDPDTTPGRLIIPADVEIQGNLFVTGNAEIGPAYIGKYHGDDDDVYAHFGHKAYKTDETGYAILQKNNGQTYVNTKEDNIYLRKNNVNIAKIYQGGAEFGNAFLGNWAHNPEYAVFCNSDMNTAENTETGYGLVQHFNGTTMLNSKHNLHFRRNGDWTKEVKLTTTGKLDVKNGFSQVWNLEMEDQPSNMPGTLNNHASIISGFLTAIGSSTTVAGNWQWKLKPSTGLP